MLNSYSTIAWAASISNGMQENVQYGYRGKNPSETTFNFLNALGGVAFAYAGHNVVLEIQATMHNVLISLRKPKWLIAAANMFVFIHVIGSYQIYAMPVFDMTETFLVKKWKFEPSKILPFTMFVGITLPFFGGLLGFFGGFAFAPTTYFLPCIMWLAIYKPKKFSLSWCTNWICIFLGLCLMILAPIGGLQDIIKEAKTYNFYS
ncbi:hypothetical protein L1987_68208 [Smallanthus sonchifolius]|uniref:Uncharacterized protein n=1 Tax=Smallanthus sonchifolius TaxID=185202 RepID=A0ACB9B3G9_9ASTR|nr:hypothetical protein L1987_68208 [Smallanthus sonchifolius]